MDPDNTGTKSEQLASYYLTMDDSYFLSQDWVSGYTPEYRNDRSLDPTSTGVDNWTSNKYTIRTVQTLFLDKTRKTAIMPLIDFIRNNALGSNYTYSKYDIGVNYVQPIKWDCTWTAGLTYYYQNYANQEPVVRTDHDYMFLRRESVSRSANGLFGA